MPNLHSTGYLKHVQKYTDPFQKESFIGLNVEGADGVDLTGKTIMITG